MTFCTVVKRRSTFVSTPRLHAVLLYLETLAAPARLYTVSNDAYSLMQRDTTKNLSYSILVGLTGLKDERLPRDIHPMGKEELTSNITLGHLKVR